MQEITAFIYDNTLLVRYDPESTLNTRNREVYARTIDLYRGVDNTFKVRVLNDHQKPVNVTGKILVFSVIDDDVNKNPRTILTAVVSLIDATKGQGQVILRRGDLDILTKNNYNWAVKISNNSEFTNYSATYVNDNWSAGGQLRVNSSVYPVLEPATLDLGTIDDGVDSAIYDFGQLQ